MDIYKRCLGQIRGESGETYGRGVVEGRRDVCTTPNSSETMRGSMAVA